jgi:predicted dehydrogenase
MYMFTPQGRQLLRERGDKRPLLPVLLIGLGPDAFIGPCAWVPNLNATGLFNVKYAAPSRDAAKADECMVDYGFAEQNVSENYQLLVRQALENDGSNLVVCICTETQNHAEQIEFCISAGVKQIVMDKPPVVDWNEWQKIQTLAVKHDCLLLVSYQHTMNSSTEQMRISVAAHIKKHGAASIEVEGGFLQDWLYQPPSEENCRQVWRLMAQWCGLLDIGTHAADGASNVVGSPIQRVLTSVHSKARIADLDKPALDNGVMDVEFANDVKGTIRYHQALPGHADDIYWMTRLKYPNGDVDSLLWRMEYGPDTLWTSAKLHADPDDLSRWERHMRGHGKAFSAEANAAFGINPGGHVQGWSDMWKIFFMRCYRAILQHQGDAELAEQMHVVSQGPCPNFSKSGGNTMGFFDAAVRCFETGQPADVPKVA